MPQFALLSKGGNHGSPSESALWIDELLCLEQCPAHSKFYICASCCHSYYCIKPPVIATLSECPSVSLYKDIIVTLGDSIAGLCVRCALINGTDPHSWRWRWFPASNYSAQLGNKHPGVEILPADTYFRWLNSQMYAQQKSLNALYQTAQKGLDLRHHQGSRSWPLSNFTRGLFAFPFCQVEE